VRGILDFQFFRGINKLHRECQCREGGLCPVTEVVGKHYRQVLGKATYDLIKDRIEAALSGHRVHYEGGLPYAFGGTRYVSAEYVPDVGSRPF
jgi:hypothetical protein